MAFATVATEIFAPGSAAATHSALVCSLCSSEKRKKAVGALIKLVTADNMLSVSDSAYAAPGSAALGTGMAQRMLYIKMGMGNYHLKTLETWSCLNMSIVSILK